MPENIACSGIMVFLEMRDGCLTALSEAAAAKAAQLSRESGQPAYGLIIMPPSDPALLTSQLACYGLSKILIYNDEAFSNFNAGLEAQVMINAIFSLKPAVVLAGASDRGKDLAAMAAATLGTGLTADCTDLYMASDGSLVQTRPAFGGNIIADIITPDSRPQFATVREAVRREKALPASLTATEFIFLPSTLTDIAGLTVLERLPRQEAISLSCYKKLVVAGCGFKNEADLELARAAAKRLGAGLCATRGLVERGWMPPELQVGLSGQSVAPEVLLTLGVSGSVQFMAGIRNAKYIIAVNHNPEAGIMSSAHLPICADLYDILPLLVETPQL